MKRLEKLLLCFFYLALGVFFGSISAWLIVRIISVFTGDAVWGNPPTVWVIMIAGCVSGVLALVGFLRSDASRMD